MKALRNYLDKIIPVRAQQDCENGNAHTRRNR